MTLMSAWLPAPDLRPPFDYFSQVANRSGHDTPSFTDGGMTGAKRKSNHVGNTAKPSSICRNEFAPDGRPDPVALLLKSSPDDATCHFAPNTPPPAHASYCSGTKKRQRLVNGSSDSVFSARCYYGTRKSSSSRLQHSAVLRQRGLQQPTAMSKQGRSTVQSFDFRVSCQVAAQPSPSPCSYNHIMGPPAVTYHHSSRILESYCRTVPSPCNMETGTKKGLLVIQPCHGQLRHYRSGPEQSPTKTVSTAAKVCDSSHLQVPCPTVSGGTGEQYLPLPVQPSSRSPNFSNVSITPPLLQSSSVNASCQPDISLTDHNASRQSVVRGSELQQQALIKQHRCELIAAQHSFCSAHCSMQHARTSRRQQQSRAATLEHASSPAHHVRSALANSPQHQILTSQHSIRLQRSRLTIKRIHAFAAKQGGQLAAKSGWRTSDTEKCTENRQPNAAYSDFSTCHSSYLHGSVRIDSAAEFMARLSHRLGLYNGEVRLLALFLWNKLELEIKLGQLSYGSPTVSFAQVVLLGCLWLAVKLEACRCQLPNASQMGALLGIPARVVSNVELQLMKTFNWAPTAGWQSYRQLYEG